jgi:hypothetical protein
MLKIKNNIYKITSQCFSYRRRTNLTEQYEIEKAEYEKKLKEYRQKHREDFWAEQSKIENKWLEEFMKTQKEKKRRDEDKLRSSIIKNSMACYNNIKRMIEEHQAFLAKQKVWREEDASELTQKHDLLTMLDRQSEDWLTPQNIDEKLEKTLNTILPPTILSHVDYYKRINKYASLIEEGYNEEAEKLKINKKILEYKNKQLEPLYHELKTIIRHLTYTEENSVYDLYNETVNRLKYHFDNHKGIEPIIEHFTGLFKKLITLIRLEYENPNTKLELIENQLKSLTMILVIWNRYVEIIYMPDEEVEFSIEHEMGKSKTNLRDRSLEDIMEEGDPKELKNYYFTQITEKKTKGKGLFLSDFKDFYDQPRLREKIGEKENTYDEEYTSYDSDLDESEIKARKNSKREKGKNLLEHDPNQKQTTKGSKGQITNLERKKKMIETEVEEVFKEPENESLSNKQSKLNTEKATIEASLKLKPTEEEKIDRQKADWKKKGHVFEDYLKTRTKEVLQGNK